MDPRVRRFGHAIRGRIPRLPRIRTFIAPADVITLSNGISGFLAIAVVTGTVKLYEPPFLPGIEKIPGLGDDRFLLAAVLITLGLVADALDGIVARKWGGSPLGADLDTLSDTITFVLAPAFLVFTWYGTERPYPALLASGLVVTMGMLRLARFNANPQEASTTTFQGLPTPWCATALTLLVLAKVPGQFALPIVAVLALLMMSNVAYPKSRGKATKLALAMVGVALAVVIAILFLPENQPGILLGTFTVLMLAIALLPLFMARRPLLPQGRRR